MKKWLAATVLLALGMLNIADPAYAREGFIMLRNAGGSDIMRSDGGVITRHYQYQLPDEVGNFLDIGSIVIVLEDADIVLDKFADRNPLVNGVLFHIVDRDSTTILYDFTAGFDIKLTTDFAFLGGTDIEIGGPGSTQRMIVHWNLLDTGASLRLLPGQYFRCVIQDKMTGLTQMSMQLKGKGNFPVIPPAPPVDTRIPGFDTNPTLNDGGEFWTWSGGVADEKVIYNVRAFLGSNFFTGWQSNFRTGLAGTMTLDSGVYTISFKLEDAATNQSAWITLGTVTLSGIPE